MFPKSLLAAVKADVFSSPQSVSDTSMPFLRTAQRPATGGAKQPPQGAEKGGADTTGMSAAQIAKIEAKRAAKAAKAAAKGAAKKEKKKAAGLGMGCAELRQSVAPSSGAAAVGVEDILGKIDPFRTGEVRTS